MKKSGKHGFTLVEIIVVLAILAILAAIAIPTYTAYIDKAKEQRYLLEARRVSDGVQYYILEKYAEGSLDRDTTKPLMMYPMGDPENPLTELLDGAYSEGAIIVSVTIVSQTGEYLNFVYEVDGYTIEFNIADGTVKIKD